MLKVDQKEAREYALDEVISAVCGRYGISSADELKAPGKTRPMAEARAVAAAIVQGAQHLRLVSLGEFLKRDISALGKGAQRVMANDRLKALAMEIVTQLQSSPL